LAEYTGMILTNLGRDLQAKAEAGTALSFTKVKIGDGQIIEGQTLEELTDLVHPLKILDIISVLAEGGGLCRIVSSITNTGITQGFYVREVGLFAIDPDLGEILYAISTTSAADYLPPEGGATVVNNQFDIIVVVGNASQITATISATGLINMGMFQAQQYENIIKNGDFWGWASDNGIPDGWAVINSDVLNSYDVSIIYWLTAPACMNLIKNAVGSEMSLCQTVIDAVIYRLKGKKVSLTTNIKTSVSSGVHATIQFLDTSSEVISTHHSAHHTGSDGYEELTISVVVPSNTYTIKVFAAAIDSDAPIGVVYIDEVTLVAGEVPMPFTNHPNDQYIKAVECQLGGDDSYFSLPRMQVGYTIINDIGAGLVGTIAVTYPSTFSNILSVVTTIDDADPSKYKVSVSDVTVTGFNLHIHNGDSVTRSLKACWIAMGVS